MHVSIRLLVALAFLAVLAASAPVCAQAPPGGPKDPNGEITADFSGTDLDRILKLVSGDLDVRFLYDDKVLKRKVNLLSPVNIKRKDLLAVLQSILEMQGFTMVKAGPAEAEIWKVVPFTQPIVNPLNKGKIKAYTMEDVKDVPEGEELATLVVRLQFVDARSAFIAVQGMASDPRMVQAIETANVVIVTDTAQNIKRISDIVRIMDVQKPGALIEVIALKYADPKDIVDKLTPLLQSIGNTDIGQKLPGQGQPDIGPGGSTQRPFLVADPRTRQIIIFALKGPMEQLKSLIRDRLDIPVKYAERQVNIIFLKNSTAKTIAAELKEMVTGITTPSTQPGAGTGQPGTGQPGTGIPQPQPPITPGGTTGTSTDTGTRIVSDDSNNAIVIVADQNTYEQLAKIVGGLDIRRPEVQIHVSIVENQRGNDLQFGIEATTIDKAKDGSLTLFSGTSFGLTRVVDLNGDQIPDGRLPVAGLAGLLTGFMKDKATNVPLILHAFEQEQKIKILAEPHLIVNDNIPATFTVKDQVPTTTNTVSNGTVITTFAGFQDASLTLKITPHISARNYLRLEIDQLIEAFRGQGQVINGTQIPPAKATRQVITTVTVPDEQTVVIGGLSDQRDDDTVQGVPYLSDIPLLGRLFQRTVSTYKRTTIYIFITPTIMWDPSFSELYTVTRAAKCQVYDETGQYIGPPEPEENEAGALDTVRFRSPFPCHEVSIPKKGPCEGVDRRDNRREFERPDWWKLSGPR